MPTIHCWLVRGPFLLSFLPANTSKAPARMPRLVMVVRSKNTDCSRLAAWVAWLQKALLAGSNRLAAWAAFAPQRPKPYTMPQGCPAIIKFSTARPASSTAPTNKVLFNTQLPALRWRPHQAANAANNARPAKVLIKAPVKPALSSKLTGSSAPRSSHQPKCTEPKKLPRENMGKIAMFSGMPRPALYSVPEPQPSATCMAAPNTNAPTSKLMLGGPKAALSSLG